MLDIEIASPDDWVKFRGQKLAAIVDPMIFRSADYFIKGRKASASDTRDRRSTTDEERWEVIRQNIGSLCAFFDTIILEDRLPLIDYGYTFDRHLGFGLSATDDLPLVQACNESAQDKVLLNVHVHSTAYRQAKSVALATMRERPAYPDYLIHEVASELSALGYDWRPDLEDIRAVSAQEEALNAFLFGGLLFNEYAQQTGGKYLIQPRRSRLELAVALPAEFVEARAFKQEMEESLFASLKKIVEEPIDGIQRTIEMPSTPTFLPYLLTFDDPTPRDLLRRALKLRKDSLVDEYRHWWRETDRELDQGRIGVDRDKEIQRIAAAIRRRIDPADDATIKLKAEWKNLVVAVDVEAEVYYQRIWGWINRQLPGRRYRKLLMRLIIAEHEYVAIEHHIRRLWARF
jgi:hypothetical protein